MTETPSPNHTPISRLEVGDTVVLTGESWKYYNIRWKKASVTNILGNLEQVDLKTEDGRIWVGGDDDFQVLAYPNGHVGVRTALPEDSAPLEQWEIELLESPEASLFRDKVQDVLKGLEDLLVEKNTSYGNAALDPIRAFSKASKSEQLRVRIDDKISRLIRGNDTFNEDTVTDLIGYLVLLKIAEKE